MFAAAASGARLTHPLAFDDDDMDEDEDDDQDDYGRDDEDDSDLDDDLDEDDEEPETWQVSFHVRSRMRYPRSSRVACESPKGRIDLTFQPLTA